MSEAPERVWVAVEATKDWVGEAFIAPDPADPCDYTEYVRADLTGLASLAAPPAPDAERIARLEALLSRMEASTRTDGGQGTMLMLPMSDQKYQGIHAATLDLLGEVRTALADTHAPPALDERITRLEAALRDETKEGREAIYRARQAFLKEQRGDLNGGLRAAILAALASPSPKPMTEDGSDG